MGDDDPAGGNRFAMSRPGVNPLVILSFLVAVTALFLPRGRGEAPAGSATTSVLSVVQNTKILRVGYEGYAPYTVRDPNTRVVSGYSVDIANAIAQEAGWTTEWVETSPETKVDELRAGKFDLMVEPIFRTIPRAARAAFTRPYAYFGYAAGIVRRGDRRFSRIADVDRAGITVAVRTGYTDQAYATANFRQARIKSMAVTDIGQLFQDVIAGNSDIALADLEQVKAFARANARTVDQLFTDPPPATVPAGFMLREGDFAFWTFLNTALDYLEANGLFEQLDVRYGVSVLRPQRQLVGSKP